LSFATDFIYNYLSRDVTASVGYDLITRQVHTSFLLVPFEFWNSNKALF